MEDHSSRTRFSRRSFVKSAGAAAMSAAAFCPLLRAFQQSSKPPQQQQGKPDDFFSGESHAKEEQSIIVETKSAFFKWMESEGVPLYSGYSVDDLGTVQAGPWKRLGIKGAMVNLSGDGGIVSAYVMEIEPGQTTIPERHMFDERIICLSGSGESHVWQPGKPKVTAKWKRGTLFAIPLNAFHEHVNGGSEPVRLVSAVSAPLIIDEYRNLDEIFNCDYVFADRFNSQPDYYKPLESTVAPKGKRYAYSVTNLVPDVYTVELFAAGHSPGTKGVGTTNHHFTMASDTLDSHVEEWQSGVYEIGHRHGPAAQVIFLTGHGYSLTWPQSAGMRPWAEGRADKVVRIPWHANSLLVPPLGWWHQHFNTTATPIRMLKLGEFGSRYYLLTSRDTFNQVPVPISYQNEDPMIRKMFEDELKKNGVPSRMPSLEELVGK